MPENFNPIKSTLSNYFESPLSIEERKELIGERLVELRKYYNLKQKEVSEILGITTATYSGYEKGKFEPSAETVVRLAYVYQTTTDYILAKEYNPNNDESENQAKIETYDPEKTDDVNMRLAIMEEELERIRNWLENQAKNKL